MSIKIQQPCCITSRLMAGIRIGDCEISIEVSGQTEEGRLVFHYFIDMNGKSYESRDLKSGCWNGDLQSGLCSLLEFLRAAGEAYRYNGNSMQEDSNTDLFPEWVCEWAYVNSEELDLACFDLGEDEVISEC